MGNNNASKVMWPMPAADAGGWDALAEYLVVNNSLHFAGTILAAALPPVTSLSDELAIIASTGNTLPETDVFPLESGSPMQSGVIDRFVAYALGRSNEEEESPWF